MHNNFRDTLNPTWIIIKNVSNSYCYTMVTLLQKNQNILGFFCSNRLASKDIYCHFFLKILTIWWIDGILNKIVISLHGRSNRAGCTWVTRTLHIHQTDQFRQTTRIAVVKVVFPRIEASTGVLISSPTENHTNNIWSRHGP